MVYLKNPKDFGFDVNIGGSDAGFPKSYFPPYKNVDVEGSGAAYLTDVLTEKAVTLMTASKEPLCTMLRMLFIYPLIQYQN